MGINNAHSSNNGYLKVNLKPKVLPMKALHFTSYKIIKNITTKKLYSSHQISFDMTKSC
jgi:hypothetical protein